MPVQHAKQVDLRPSLPRRLQQQPQQQQTRRRQARRAAAAMAMPAMVGVERPVAVATVDEMEESEDDMEVDGTEVW